MSQPIIETNPSVTRTYRAAIRLGEDYLTVEQITTLPLDATDDTIQQAIALGQRIFQAQHQAVQVEIAQLRAATAETAPPPPRLASDRQRSFIDALARELGWNTTQLTTFAAEHDVAAWDTMTHAQAGTLIDALKAHKTSLEQHTASEGSTQAPAILSTHPEPRRIETARATLAAAEQRTGVRPSPELPPVGTRIRNPDDPATPAQLTRITRTIASLSDPDLKPLAPQIAAVLGYQRVAFTGLRDAASWSYLRDEVTSAHRLTKGRASQIIALLETATAAAPAA